MGVTVLWDMVHGDSWEGLFNSGTPTLVGPLQQVLSALMLIGLQCLVKPWLFPQPFGLADVVTLLAYCLILYWVVFRYHVVSWYVHVLLWDCMNNEEQVANKCIKYQQMCNEILPHIMEPLCFLDATCEAWRTWSIAMPHHTFGASGNTAIDSEEAVCLWIQIAGKQQWEMAGAIFLEK